ncbi:MAG TPA: hypothetical protein ENJ33_02825 [Thiothrix sp.]|nr:hypothetical protein [Thiothrix sp.]
MSAELFDAVRKLSLANIRGLYREIIPILQHLKGANVDYRPMYPNFPKPWLKIVMPHNIHFLGDCICALLINLI